MNTPKNLNAFFLSVQYNTARPQIFQYNMFNNVFYIIKIISKFWRILSPLCFFFKINDENPAHMLRMHKNKLQLFDELQEFCSNALFFFRLAYRVP